MGRDKASLRWGNTTLADHMVQLVATICGSARLVGGADLPDKVPDAGPLGGILTALDATSEDWNLIVGVDLPLLSPQFLEFLTQRPVGSSKNLVVCQSEGRYPLCLMVHRHLRKLIGNRIFAGQLSVKGFIEAADPEVISSLATDFPDFSASIFSNVNTADDWARLQPRDF